MTMQTQTSGHDVAADADVLRKLHVPGDPLILANVWDPTSALVVEAAGVRAIATASNALAPVNGFEDHCHIPADVAFGALRRIADAVKLPVTADLEDGYGLSPEEFVDRLAEAVQVVKGLLTEGPCSFDGEHYRVDGLDGTPKPVQRPHPPILIGGGGRRLLTLAAREADIVGLSPAMVTGGIDATTAANGTAEVTDERVALIRDVAGERWQHIELQVRVHLAMVTDQRDEHRRGGHHHRHILDQQSGGGYVQRDDHDFRRGRHEQSADNRGHPDGQ